MWLNSVISKACVNKSFYDIVAPYQRLQMGREGRQRTVIYSDIVRAYSPSIPVTGVLQFLSRSYEQDWVTKGRLEVKQFYKESYSKQAGISPRMVPTDAEWGTNILSRGLTIILLDRSYSERDLFWFRWKIDEKYSVVFNKTESGPRSTYSSPWQNQDSWTMCRLKKPKQKQSQPPLK